jgi:hypothetical protein
MQNKAKFQKVKLNVTEVLTTDYGQMDTWSIRKNEPKTNPNEPNLSRPNLRPSRIRGKNDRSGDEQKDLVNKG